jgi:excisionase family DNA binding protein
MTARSSDGEKLLTPAEVAALFRVDPKTVTRWAKAGKLTSIRTLGGHRRYRAAEVYSLLDQVSPAPLTRPTPAPRPGPAPAGALPPQPRRAAPAPVRPGAPSAAPGQSLPPGYRPAGSVARPVTLPVTRVDSTRH